MTASSLDRVAAIEQLALVAVDVGDRRIAGGRRQEARVVGELAGLAVERADVDDVRTDGPGEDRELDGRRAVGEGQRGGAVGHLECSMRGGFRRAGGAATCRVGPDLRLDSALRLPVVASTASARRIRGRQALRSDGEQRRSAGVAARCGPPAGPTTRCRRGRAAGPAPPRPLSDSPAPRASRNRARIRSFSSMPRRQRQRRRFSCVRPSARSPPGAGSARQTARLTMTSLILPIASVGLRPLGQTSTQFMIVWQRNSRYGSSRLSSRSLVAWSRVSAMKR